MIPDIGQGIIPKPYQKPRLPIVVTAVVPFSRGVTEAAKRGGQPISANFLPPRWVASHWPKYAEGCEATGRRPDPVRSRVAKTVFVADDADTARRYGYGETSPCRCSWNQLFAKLLRAGRINLFKPSQDTPHDPVTLDLVVDALVLVGTPEQVVAQLLALRETTADFVTLYDGGIGCLEKLQVHIAKRPGVLMWTGEKILD